jgi:hypothetical protein
MPTPPQTDTRAPPIATRTVRVLHDFVRDAVSQLSRALNDSAPEFEDVIRLERGADGLFRERKKRVPTLWPLLSDESLWALPSYEPCLEYLRSDAVVGPHLDRLVGSSSMGALRLDARWILTRLISAMIDEEGHLIFTSQKFYSKWQELADFFASDRIAYKTIAPLPYLVVPIFPLRLNDELVLDRLTEDEVTRCYNVGVLRPHFSGYPFVNGEWAVGIRRTTSTPKLIRQDDEPFMPPEAQDEGSFGERPPYRGDLTIDDVISALRLFKGTQIRAAGLAIWTDALGLAGATQSQELWRWPYGGRFELSESEVPQFLELWHFLEEGGAARFNFPVRRFNLSFERGLLDDRIVDLVIAAEALFLSDMGPRDRGEHRFRVALRAAKFIEHPSYSEHEVFRLMRRAYDVRSAIVHGASPEDTGLPDSQSADLRTFTDAIEDLVRLGLRKALSMKQDGKKLRQAKYWDSLVLSKLTP